MHKGVQLLEVSHSHEQLKMLERQIERQNHMLTNMLAPAIYRIKEIHCEMTAELHITQTGLALLQYKQSRDAFPETLEALNLQNIQDPFSGQPLRYKTQGQGFILYSVGPDQKDNGGSPKEKKQEEDREYWDIVWSYDGARIHMLSATHNYK